MVIKPHTANNFFIFAVFAYHFYHNSKLMLTFFFYYYINMANCTVFVSAKWAELWVGFPQRQTDCRELLGRVNCTFCRSSGSSVLMTFDCMRFLSPAYFRDARLPVWYVTARIRLRSADRRYLIFSVTRTAGFGPRSFCVSAPTTWNELPLYLKNIPIGWEQFKVGLKTWLFRSAY